MAAISEVTVMKKRLAILLTAALLLTTACNNKSEEGEAAGTPDSSASSEQSPPDAPQKRFAETRLYAATAVTRSGAVFSMTTEHEGEVGFGIYRGGDYRMEQNGELLVLTLGGVTFFRDDNGDWRFIQLPEADTDGGDSVDFGARLFAPEDFTFVGSGVDEFDGREADFEDFSTRGLISRHFFDGNSLVGERIIGFTDDVPEEDRGGLLGAERRISISTAIPEGAFNPPYGAVEMPWEEYFASLPE
jgi:hypothetical protein